MNARPDEELLSAYLDGEVTASERAEVERHLAENAASRRLLEQLRAVREDVSTLPRYQLDADFSRRVLEAAERELLEVPVAAANPPAANQSATDHAAGESTNVGSVSPADSSRRTHGGWLPDPRSRLHPRRLLRSASWALIATAAGLLLMFAFPAREQIATGPDAAVRQLNVPVHGEMSAPDSEDTAGQLPTTDEEAAPASIARPGADARRTLTTPASDADRPLAKSAAPGAGESPSAPEPSGAAELATSPEQATEPAQAPEIDEFRLQNAELSRQMVSRAAPRGAGRGLLVVQLDLSPEAVDQQALDQVLTRNAIRVAPGSATPQLATHAKQPLEMVYVEATPAQLEATLTELAEEPRYFQNVAVADQSFPTRPQFGMAQQQPESLSLPPQAVTNDVRPYPPQTRMPTMPAPTGMAETAPARSGPRGQAFRLHLEPESQEFIARSQTPFREAPSAAEPAADASAISAGVNEAEQFAAPADSAAAPTDLAADEATTDAADSLLGALFIIRVLGLPPADDDAGSEAAPSSEAAPPVAGPQPADETRAADAPQPGSETPTATDTPPAAVETPSTTPPADGETAP